MYIYIFCNLFLLFIFFECVVNFVWVSVSSGCHPSPTECSNKFCKQEATTERYDTINFIKLIVRSIWIVCKMISAGISQH